MTKSFVLAAAVLFSFTVPANITNAATYRVIEITQQPEEGWATIKTADGLLFVWNLHGLYFTLSLKGKEIKPLDDQDHIFFSVDGKILQIQLAPINSFAPDAKEKKLSDKSILAAHRDWEAAFVEGLLKNKLAVRTFNTKLSDGHDALMWQFDMPEGTNAESKKQVYLTVVKNDYVLLLNSVVTVDVPDSDSRKFLLDTAATFKQSATPIDLKQLSESIRKSAGP